ncbi:MAG: nuclear transport factor 2 family protein, partial [Streptomyces sp.]|nr:nuclear transport factor 2 family protein [Streptomyces sp.]
MSSSTDDKAILDDVLDRWKAGVDAHQPERVAALFTEDALFQGLHPYSVGRRGVAEYYDSQPLGMKAEYRILETRRPADGLVLGYLDVDFTFTDRPTLAVKLAVL